MVVILQEKKLLDLPKLLDICALYGHENEELAKLLVSTYNQISHPTTTLGLFCLFFFFLIEVLCYVKL